MTQHVLLNNLDHQHTKVINQYSERYGDNVASVMAFPSEFIELQKEYPIVFRQDGDDSKFQCSVLLGMQSGENLYLSDNTDSGWNARYIPAVMAKGPFLIGFQNQQENGLQQQVPVVHIDMAHPKVNEQKGQPLFLEHGGNSPYLERVSTVLQIIHQGMTVNDQMFAAFSQCDLIEPVNINVDLNNGEQIQLQGNYTINENKLQALSGEQLTQLNQQGFLQLAYAVVASMSNIGYLIDAKNRLNNKQK